MSVRTLCKVLHVNGRWYYACHKPSEKQAADRKLREDIEQIVEAFAGYGYRRVTHALVRAGWSVTHKRVLRVMREESLLCRHKRRFVHTTDSHHRYHVYLNLVQGMQVEAPDMVWVADSHLHSASQHVCVREPVCWMRIHANVWDGSCPNGLMHNWLWMR